MSTKTQRYSEDPRVEKAATWVFSLVVTIALSMGALYFKALAETQTKLAQAINKLNTKVEVLSERGLQMKDFKTDVRALEERVLRLEQKK